MTTKIVKQGPVGTQYSYNAPVMTTMMVSLSTPTNDNSFRYWAFTPTESGRVLIDTRLSESDADFVNSALVITGGIQNSYGQDEEGAYVTQGHPQYGTSAVFVDVVAGTRYVIGVVQYQQYDYENGGWKPLSLVNHVVRISDYGRVVNGSVPNQIIAFATGSDTYQYDGSTGTVTTIEKRGQIQDYDEVGQFGWGGTRSGTYDMHRALGGPNPGDVFNARQCTWNQAVTSAGVDGIYWGGYPTAMNPEFYVEWNQDQQVCRNIGVPLAPNSGYIGPAGTVGYHGRAYSWLWWYNDLVYDIYGMQYGLSLDQMRGLYMQRRHYDWLTEQYGDLQTGGDGTGYTVVWDDWYAIRNTTDHQHPLPGEIVNLWWSPDFTASDPGDLAGYTIFGALNKAELSAGSASHWAAPLDSTVYSNFPMPEGANNSYWPEGMGPTFKHGSDEDFGYFEPTPDQIYWRKLDDSILESAKTYEKNAAAPTPLYNDNSYDSYSSFTSFWFAAVPGTTNDTALGSSIQIEQTGGEFEQYKTLVEQTLDFKMESIYPDFVMTVNPPYPDASLLGVAGQQVGDGADFVARN